MVRLPKKLSKYLNWKLFSIFILLIITTSACVLYYQKTNLLNNEISILTKKERALGEELLKTENELIELKNQDQIKRNNNLEETIKNIEVAYKRSVEIYEKMVDLPTSAKKSEHSELFAQSLDYLSQRNFSSASATLTDLDKKIAAAQIQVSTSFTIPANVPTQNTPPTSGHSRQKVVTDIGEFLVDIITADLNSTRVIVDTASDSDCRDNCPVMSLGDYAARSGAFAGINGSYFCPADYPSCAGKTNSFDTLLMNKNKTYFNSDNNIYSTVPAVIFLNGSMRFVGASQEWGRDTGVDGVIANQPLLLSSGNITFGGGSDPKQGSRGSRSFVASTGSTGYIGVVHNATVAEVAVVLQKMGIQNALNLDSGGSTALWAGGYKVGPGRNLPNAVLFVRK